MDKSIQIWNWYWWSHRYALTILLMAVLAAQLSAWLILNSSWTGSEATCGVILVFSALAGTLISISVFSSGRNLDLTAGDSAFPKWLALMPISSQTLATVPIVGVLLTLAFSWIPFALTIRVLFPELTVFYFVVLPWVFLGSVATWIQALSWCPFRTGWHRLATLVVLVLTYTFLFLIGELIATWFQVGVIVAMLICGTAAAYVGLFRARLQETTVERLQIAVDAQEKEKKLELSFSFQSKSDFISLERSLLWRDWHQISRIVVGIMAIISFAVLLLVLFGQASGRVMLLFPFVPTLLMTTTGINFGKNAYFKPKSAMPVYLAGLPISNRAFLRARFRVCMMTSLLVWGLSFVPFVVWMFGSESLGELKVQIEQIQGYLGIQGEHVWRIVAVYFAFSLFSVVACPFPSMALGLCGRPKLETTLVSILGAIGFVLVLVVCWGFVVLTDGMKDPEGLVKIQSRLTEWLPLILIGLLLVKIVFATFAFRISRRRVSSESIVDSKSCIKLLMLGIATAAILFALMPAGLQLRLNFLMFSIWMFPVGSIFLTAFALDWNRHR